MPLFYIMPYWILCNISGLECECKSTVEGGFGGFSHVCEAYFLMSCPHIWCFLKEENHRETFVSTSYVCSMTNEVCVLIQTS